MARPRNELDLETHTELLEDFVTFVQGSARIQWTHRQMGFATAPLLGHWLLQVSCWHLLGPSFCQCPLVVTENVHPFVKTDVQKMCV